MRYIAGLLQGCFMKTKINFIGSKSSPCLKEKSCQVWGYAVTRCSQNYRATQLSDHASCLSCLFFMFPPLPALWITGLLPDGMFKINCIIPLILWLQGLIPQTLPTLHKLPPPGITCLVWQVIVGRGGGAVLQDSTGIFSAAQKMLLSDHLLDGFLSFPTVTFLSPKNARNASKKLWFCSAPHGPPSCLILMIFPTGA